MRESTWNPGYRNVTGTVDAKETGRGYQRGQRVSGAVSFADLPSL